MEVRPAYKNADHDAQRRATEKAVAPVSTTGVSGCMSAVLIH